MLGVPDGPNHLVGDAPSGGGGIGHQLDALVQVHMGCTLGAQGRMKSPMLMRDRRGRLKLCRPVSERRQ